VADNIENEVKDSYANYIEIDTIPEEKTVVQK